VHAVQAVQVWSKSISNEGHLTLEAETFFRPSLPSHCSGLNETSYVSLLVHPLQAVLVSSKLVIYEWHFILEAEKFIRFSVASP
jgi:hypothetical protein